MITTIGIFATQADAEAALHELRAIGVKEDEISYVYMNSAGDVLDKQEGEKIGHATVTGATTGAVVGAVLGFAVASGVLPGLGSLIAAGPLAAALGLTGAAAVTAGGAMTGVVTGGLIGAITSLGVSDADADRFGKYIQSGDVLVSVRLTSSGMKEIFLRTHAREVQEYVQ